MKFTVSNPVGKTKVAFFSKNSFGTTLSEIQNIDTISYFNDIQVHLFETENESFRVFKEFSQHKKLDSNQSVQGEYENIISYLQRNSIEICIFFGSGYPWTETFIKKIRRFSYAACYFGDDPEGSNHTSRWYVRYYDYAFCGGVYFDSKRSIAEVYKEWGAENSKFIPLGANPTKYKLPFNNLSDRNVDIMYVGGAYLKKILNIFFLKKHFGDRLYLYGRGWNYEGGNILKKVIEKTAKTYYRIPKISELPKDALIELYQNTKIGFNTHMSYGPSNLRLYELPMNGVMQVCDCRDGLSLLYEIDKEVVAYDSIGEAVEKIEYYLAHDDERKKIAMAGYLRAQKNYRLEQSFSALIQTIFYDKGDLNR